MLRHELHDLFGRSWTLTDDADDLVRVRRSWALWFDALHEFPGIYPSSSCRVFLISDLTTTLSEFKWTHSLSGPVSSEACCALSPVSQAAEALRRRNTQNYKRLNLPFTRTFCQSGSCRTFGPVKVSDSGSAAVKEPMAGSSHRNLLKNSNVSSKNRKFCWENRQNTDDVRPSIVPLISFFFFTLNLDKVL